MLARIPTQSCLQTFEAMPLLRRLLLQQLRKLLLKPRRPQLLRRLLPRRRKPRPRRRLPFLRRKMHRLQRRRLPLERRHPRLPPTRREQPLGRLLRIRKLSPLTGDQHLRKTPAAKKGPVKAGKKKAIGYKKANVPKKGGKSGAAPENASKGLKKKPPAQGVAKAKTSKAKTSDGKSASRGAQNSKSSNTKAQKSKASKAKT